MGTITFLAFYTAWQQSATPATMHTKMQALRLSKGFIRQYLNHFEAQHPAVAKLKALPKTVQGLP